MPALPHDDSVRFIRDGFIRVDDAFSRDAAQECRERVAALAGIDLDAPSTWTAPVVRQPGAWHAIFDSVINAPKLVDACDALIGVDRWMPRHDVGLVVIRFPSSHDPGDAGWHIEGSFESDDGKYWTNVQSRGRAVLLLVLLSDVGPDDAPTLVRVGSHLRIPAKLLPFGDRGTQFSNVAVADADVRDCPVVPALGAAGDVYLCHPFLVHRASWPHRGRAPRFVAQPGLPPRVPFDYSRADSDYSPVELAVRIGLGMTTLDDALLQMSP